MSIFAISLIAFLSILLSVSIYYNCKFGLLILKIEDAIEESLDILDERYRVISEIALKPVFFDSLEIRHVISEIKKSRDAILFIANRLTNPDYIKKIEEVDNESFTEIEKNNDKKSKKNN